MKKLIRLLSFFVCLLASVTSYAQQPITYPIEVLSMLNSNDEWIDTVQISITTKDYQGTVGWLYVNVNNLNNASTMQYRLKESSQSEWGSWQTSQPNFSVFPKDEAYGGLNGGFGTTQFATPIIGVEANKTYDFQFKYDYISGRESSGYRILDMAFWESNNKHETNQILNGRQDVTGENWEGPYANDPNKSTLSEEGGRLWRGEVGEVLIDPNGIDIKATCADCHTASGWDLKYFNYSDKSIIARSNFHGMSREEGEKVAQYIRDLAFDRSEKGRPWQPPFQPGPEADDDPYEWAAGQGLENVLETDEDMIAEVFGSKNPSEEEIRSTINDFNGNTNLRTQRLAVQFPDWNGWLPGTHPKDLLSDEDYNTINSAYLALRSALDTPSKIEALNNQSNIADNHANNGIYKAIGDFSTQVHNVIEGTNKNNPRSPVWADNNSVYQPERETLMRSLAPWFSIKIFEVIHEFGLHNISELQNIALKDQEKFQWPTREWVVFQNAAHIISERRGTSYFSLTDTTRDQQTRSIYLSSIWYQMQMTLTPGNRKGGVVSPNDWAYNLLHVHRIGLQSEIYEPARWLQNYLKNAEQRNNGMTPKESSSGAIRGWNMRELSPWRFYGTTNGNTETFDQLGPDLRNRVQSVFIDEVLDVLESFGNEWNRDGVNLSYRTDFELEFYDTEPINGVTFQGDNCLFHDRRDNGGCSDANDAVEIDAMYTLLYLFSENGNITTSVFNRLRGWADEMWAFTDWPTYTLKATHNWAFNGDLSDKVGNADGMAQSNAKTMSDDKVEGFQSLFLDGTEDMVLINDAELQNGFTDYSVTAWFRTTDTIGYQYIYEEGGNDAGFGLRLNGSTLEAGAIDGSGITTLQTVKKEGILPFKWYFAAVTFENGVMNLYLNAEDDPSTLDTGFGELASHSNGATIGGSGDQALDHGAGFEFSGWIDDVRVYDETVIGQQEITLIYDEYSSNIKTFSLLVQDGTGTGLYEVGQQISIVADTTLGCFLNWKGDTESLSDITGSQAVITVPNKNIAVIAEFDSACGEGILTNTDVAERIEIFPNPFTELVSVSGVKQDAEITILTLSGVELLCEKGETVFNLSGLSKGIYILRVNHNFHRIVKK